MDISNESIMTEYPNLKPIQKGEVRNPRGRIPGSKNRSTIVKEILELMHESGQTYEYAATLAVAQKAAGGDTTAWEKLMDSAHGKTSDNIKLDHTSSDKSMSPGVSRITDLLTKKPDAKDA